MTIVVGIVGRPNVGKSTLFNLLIGKGISVVSEVEGTTRDILIKRHKNFVFIDSGGVVAKQDELSYKVVEKVQDVMDNSDVILFVVDNYEGLTAIDEFWADVIRKKGLKHRTILILNKSESSKTKEEEFFKLGFDKSLQISCKTKMNVNEILFMVQEIVDKYGFVDSKYRSHIEEGRKIGFVGRPNVGKSSLVNSILNDERVIVSELAGTTRDSIDIPFKFQDHRFVLIDTPGVRRRTSVSSKLEAYSITRALGTIKYADIVILVLDIYEGLTRQDKRLVYQISKYEKPCLIVANKFDLVIDQYKNNSSKFSNQFVENLKYELSEYIKSQLYLIPYAPVVFVSAKTKYQIDSIIYSLVSIDQQLQKDLSSIDLKNLLENVVLSLPYVESNGKKVRMKIKQVKYYREEIPTLKIYTNISVPPNIKSYLKNTLSKTLNIPNVPIRILFSNNA